MTYFEQRAQPADSVVSKKNIRQYLAGYRRRVNPVLFLRKADISYIHFNKSVVVKYLK